MKTETDPPRRAVTHRMRDIGVVGLAREVKPTYHQQKLRQWPCYQDRKISHSPTTKYHSGVTNHYKAAGRGETDFQALTIMFPCS